ncbi:MAG: ABC transporter ATP-binding protein [Desulfovibrionales bacterium]
MITLEHLTKYFNRGSANQVLALDRIDLTIRPGDFITVIGSNGAGKSTLLSCLAGSFPPDQGRIMLDDLDISGWPEHRRAAFIGRVFQDPLRGTCASLTIRQNMALAAGRGGSRGLSPGVKRRDLPAFREKLAQIGLGLEDRLLDRVGLLSGGQRQALTMIMATLIRPRILLLDEHTAALDPKTAGRILERTEQLVREMELTTLMVTHNMNQAIRLGNRLIMLHRGRIILDLAGREKADLTMDDLLAYFYEHRDDDVVSDRMLLL